jgi:hypothetical protein
MVDHSGTRPRLDVVDEVCAVPGYGQSKDDNRWVMDDALGVGRLFFEDTDEAVARSWGDQV